MEEGHISEPPSRRRLLMMLGCGTVVAAALLTCIILPAEYGIDPLGTGKALGLTGIAAATAKKETPSPITTSAVNSGGASITPVLLSTKQTSRWGESAVVQGALIAQSQHFNVDAREITLQPGEGMEIKYHLPKGAGLIYSWTATAPVLFDFHAEPDVTPTGEVPGEYSESYVRDDTRGTDHLNGTLIAPNAGIHGWYWENTGAEPVNVRVIASGFYDWIYQNRDEQTTRLKPTDGYALPSHPTVPDESL
jgi:hypothetical protein